MHFSLLQFTKNECEERDRGWGEERELTFDGKCDRGSGGLWPVNSDGDGDDDERLNVLLSSSLLLLPSIFGSVLVRNIFCLNLCFGNYFCFSGSVFRSRICIDFCFQRLQYEGSNEFSQIWLITVISYIPLVLADHCTSSIF